MRSSGRFWFESSSSRMSVTTEKRCSKIGRNRATTIETVRPPADAGQRVVQEVPAPRPGVQEVDGDDRHEVARRHDAAHREQHAARRAPCRGRRSRRATRRPRRARRETRAPSARPRRSRRRAPRAAPDPCPATRLTTIGPAANGIAKFTAPDAPSRLGESACARAKRRAVTTAKRMPVARTEPKTTPVERSRLRRRCRRASSQKAAAARICRIRMPGDLDPRGRVRRRGAHGRDPLGRARR